MIICCCQLKKIDQHCIVEVHPERISLDPEIFGIEGHPEGLAYGEETDDENGDHTFLSRTFMDARLNFVLKLP